MFWLIASTLVAAMMATAMMVLRLKASKQPASVKKIILPPIFMSTGAFMYLVPAFRLDLSEIAEALIVGIIFSVFLIKTSKFQIKGEQIYLIPSKAFVFVLIGLLLVRIIIKVIIGATISVGETSGMFFLLAFGMIISWRLAMLYKYKKLEKKLNQPEST
ncbi:cytochrome c biogenesis protein CcdC [Barrientosiimonas marina]|uniref:CcdC family protein n=1 Tax=Lentibacillus kimchii TaxID=1542911 RepID=A0ABW2V0Y5_9BACI